MAARFWNVPAWEIEGREDADYWISRALMFRQAENQAEEIATELARQRAK